MKNLKIIGILTIIMLFSCDRGVLTALEFFKSGDSFNELPIPPVLVPDKINGNESIYSLTVKTGLTEFYKGVKVITYGYNGSLLGPTIRGEKGGKITINVSNELHEYTTVHWHGMLVPGEMDGGPHQVIAPDAEWTASFTVDQPALTAWYHPHGLGTTARQVYAGLAGMIIIDDENSKKLNLPDEYGVNDIPLIVQDREFNKEGVPVYLRNMSDIMYGMTGNTVLVNGTVNPYRNVARGKYRFRLLNGSNARVYRFSLSDKTDFLQIATDGGLIEHPVKLDSIVLSPGERAEIVIDFSRYDADKKIRLVSGRMQIIEFRVGSEKKDDTAVPENLAAIERYSTSDAAGKRYFDLQGMGHMVSINGRRMKISRIDEFMKAGDTEIWNVRSSSGGMGMMGGANVIHNFHAHGVQFLILDRDGIPAEDYESGWKDTVLVNDGETVRLITRYLKKGVFMYHCHILEHEDNGMMGQFKVE